jgi:hypothetical protein
MAKEPREADPDEELIEGEAGVPLPNREVMSIIDPPGGPKIPLPEPEPPITSDPPMTTDQGISERNP